MVRTKRLVAVGSTANVEIDIKIRSTLGLTRTEASHLVDDLTDRVMKQIPDTRYLSVPLSKIKVT